MTEKEIAGIKQAKLDIAKGDLRYKWTGHGGLGGVDFCRLVKERLEMQVDDFGICFVTRDQIEFANGYNCTVTKHVVTTFGRDIIDESFQEARALFKERYDRQFNSDK